MNEVIRCDEECGGCSCHDNPPCNHCVEHVHDGDWLLEQSEEYCKEITKLNKEVTKLRRKRTLSDFFILFAMSFVVGMILRIAAYLYFGGICKLQ